MLVHNSCNYQSNHSLNQKDKLNKLSLRYKQQIKQREAEENKLEHKTNIMVANGGYWVHVLVALLLVAGARND